MEKKIAADIKLFFIPLNSNRHLYWIELPVQLLNIK